jgi:CDP-glucose 4,6-dehydratase
MEYKPNLEKMVTLAHLTPYFKDKKILLTGHTGFKGSWMLQVLAKMGAKICGYSLAPENATDLFNQIDGDNLCVQNLYEDVRDAKRMQQAIISFEPDFIFHLAAQPLVIDSYTNPLYTFEVNAQGTANLLDAMKQLNKKCICVCITTDKVYENPENGIPFIESDKLGGHDPYSASKAAAEIIINSYRQSFFEPTKFATHQKSVASVRAGNVIGGGDFAQHRIIPDIVKSIEADKTLILRNPNATRPWQHVIEPIGAYLLLASKMWDAPEQFSTAYNFGPETNDVLTVQALVEKAIAVFGKGSFEIQQDPNQKHEAQNLMLNIDKAKKDLHWEPKYNALQSIEKTIEWYKDARNGDVKCLEHINQYFEASINDADDH